MDTEELKKSIIENLDSCNREQLLALFAVQSQFIIGNELKEGITDKPEKNETHKKVEKSNKTEKVSKEVKSSKKVIEPEVKTEEEQFIEELDDDDSLENYIEDDDLIISKETDNFFDDDDDITNERFVEDDDGDEFISRNEVIGDKYDFEKNKIEVEEPIESVTNIETEVKPEVKVEPEVIIDNSINNQAPEVSNEVVENNTSVESFNETEDDTEVVEDNNTSIETKSEKKAYVKRKERLPRFSRVNPSTWRVESINLLLDKTKGVQYVIPFDINDIKGFNKLSDIEKITLLTNLFNDYTLYANNIDKLDGNKLKDLGEDKGIKCKLLSDLKIKLKEVWLKDYIKNLK